MKMRPLTPDGPEISEISIGTSGIGGPNWLRGVPHGWPEVDLDAVTEAIRLAIDAGVNHFDTAVCIRFVLCHANVAGVIHGFQGPEAVRSNLHAVACALTDEDVEWLREVFGELRESE